MLMPTTDTTGGRDRIPAGAARAHITALIAQDATYRSIARAAGVAHVTVRAIDNGQPTCTPTTATRIQAVRADQARRPPNRGGRKLPGSPRRIYADDLEVLISDRATVADVVTRLGLARRDNLLRWIQRNNRQDLLRQLRANETRAA